MSADDLTGAADIVPASGSASDDVAATETLDQAIERLASLPPLEYDKVRRTEAKALGVRVETLDSNVHLARRGRRGDDPAPGGGRPLSLPLPEPWHEPVDGLALVEEVAQHFKCHLSIAQEEAPLTLALWAFHTHSSGCTRHSPRLAITSPEKGCGKTTVLDLLEMVVAKPLPTANITSAALFRAIEAVTPTLLIDEADTFVPRNEELRGILNAGHRPGGQVVRCVGDDHEPRAFAVYAPAAIAAIGTLPGTLADRSITIRMRRASADQRPMSITAAVGERASILLRKLARWANDMRPRLADIDPEIPGQLSNRAADNWRPLFAIATLIGPSVHKRLEVAATAPAEDDGRDGLSIQLLKDIYELFEKWKPLLPGSRPPRLPSQRVVSELVEREDRPWAEMPDRYKELNVHRLSRMLRPFRVQPRQLRLSTEDQKALGFTTIRHDVRVWGYEASDFADAFARYLTVPSPLPLHPPMKT